MASRRTARFNGARTARPAARWRRAAVGAVGVLVAAALIGPSAANANRFDVDPVGGASPKEPIGAASAQDADASGGAAEPALPALTAQAAIVVDRATGEVLGAKNPDQWRAPASTTKLMTALIASEAITAGEASLSDTVRIPADVSFEIWDDGVELMPVVDTISLQDLLYMTLVSSAGDAATTVAMHIGGYPSLSGLDAREAFIERMNDRAAELGLHDTSFVNVSGADPEDLGPSSDDAVGAEDQDVPGYEKCTNGDHFLIPECAHYSTARDLATLARVALDDPLLATIVSTPSWTTTTWRRSEGFGGAIGPVRWSRSNTNQLLPGGLQAYWGAYGVKTGTSGRAGENLISAARNPEKPSPSLTAPGAEAAVSAGQVAAGLQSKPFQLYQGSHTSDSGEPAENSQTPASDVIAVVLGSDDNDPDTTVDRFVDSKIVLDFALGRVP